MLVIAREKWESCKVRRAARRLRASYRVAAQDAETPKRKRELEAEGLELYVQTILPELEELETRRMRRLANRYGVLVPSYPPGRDDTEHWHKHFGEVFVLTELGHAKIRQDIRDMKKQHAERVYLYAKIAAAVLVAVASLLNIRDRIRADAAPVPGVATRRTP